MISSKALHLGPLMLPWTLIIILIGLMTVSIIGQMVSNKLRWDKAGFSGFFMDQCPDWAHRGKNRFCIVTLGCLFHITSRHLQDPRQRIPSHRGYCYCYPILSLEK